MLQCSALGQRLIRSGYARPETRYSNNDTVHKPGILLGIHSPPESDVAPGRIFRGTVSSVGYGVDQSGGASPGALPTVEGASGWLRDPLRFPVVVRFDVVSPQGLLWGGGQVDVIVYTGNNFILNGIGKLRIRLSSLLSYVR